MPSRSWKREAAEEQGVELFADGLDEALLGVGERCGSPPLAVYDVDACVRALVKRDGMTEGEAVEFLEFNSIGAWVGERTPVWVRRLKR